MFPVGAMAEESTAEEPPELQSTAVEEEQEPAPDPEAEAEPDLALAMVAESEPEPEREPEKESEFDPSTEGLEGLEETISDSKASEADQSSEQDEEIIIPENVANTDDIESVTGQDQPEQLQLLYHTLALALFFLSIP